MKPAWVPLAEITLTSTDSEVVFGSIPNTYRDLIVIVDGQSTSGFPISYEIRANSDTSNYSQVIMQGTGSVSSSTASKIHFILSGLRSSAIIQVMDYSATDKHKTFLVRSNAHSASDVDLVEAGAGRWASTSAITSITLKDQDSGWQFAIGSTFSLYGIEA